MHHYFFFQHQWTKILAICAILTLFMACGTSNSANTSQITKMAGAPAKNASNKQNTETAGVRAINVGKISIDVSGLHIQSVDKIECDPGSSLSHTPSNQLVLAENRTSYTGAEIQQIRDYLSELAQTDETTTAIANLKTPLPSTLSWVSGAIRNANYGCYTILEITNTGNAVIQIPKVSARLAVIPQQNTYHYRLINACSLLSLSKCRYQGSYSGGPEICASYLATIHLGMGQKGSVFSTTPTTGPGCRQMTLAPSTTTELYLSFTSPPPNHLVYSLVTELTLQTAKGQQVVELPQLGKTVAFADKSLVTCFNLQNQSPIVETKPLFSYNTTNCI